MLSRSSFSLNQASNPFSLLPKMRILNFLLVFTASLAAAATVPQESADTLAETGASETTSHLHKRIKLDESCRPKEKDIKKAVAKCKKIANKAAKAARNEHDARFEQYFGSAAPAYRNRVARRYDAIAEECERSDGEIINCDDPEKKCTDDSDNVLAYYTRGKGVTLCGRLLKLYKVLPERAGEYSIAGSILHELSHAPLVPNLPVAVDTRYGRENVRGLPAESAVRNADTFQWFAMDVWLRIPADSSSPVTTALDDLERRFGNSRFFFLVTTEAEGPSHAAQHDGFPVGAESEPSLERHFAMGAQGHGYVSLHDSLEAAVQADIADAGLAEGWIHAVQPSNRHINATATLLRDLPREIASIGGVPNGDIAGSFHFEYPTFEPLVENPNRDGAVTDDQYESFRLSDPTPQLAGLPPDDELWRRPPYDFYASYPCGNRKLKRDEGTCPLEPKTTWLRTLDEVKDRGTACYKISSFTIEAHLDNWYNAGTNDAIALRLYEKDFELFNGPSAGASAMVTVKVKDAFGTDWIPSHYFADPFITVKKATWRPAPQFAFKGK